MVVSIDHVDGLGDFIEIELVVDEDKMEDDRVQQGKVIVASLSKHLDLENPISESYLELVLNRKDPV